MKRIPAIWFGLFGAFLINGFPACAGETRFVFWGGPNFFSSGVANAPPTATNLNSVILHTEHGVIALKADGTLVRWGGVIEENAPHNLSMLTNIVKIAGGASGSPVAALDKDGKVYIWNAGYYVYGSNYQGSPTFRTLTLTNPSQIIDLGIGWDRHVIILRSDGRAYLLSDGIQTDGSEQQIAENVLKIEKQTSGFSPLLKNDGFVTQIGSQEMWSNYGISNNIVLSVARFTQSSGWSSPRGPSAFLLAGGAVIVRGSGSELVQPPVEATNITAIAGADGGFHALKADGSVISWGLWGTNSNPYLPPSNLAGVKTLGSYFGIVGSVNEPPSITASSVAPEVANILAADPVFINRIITNTNFVAGFAQAIISGSNNYGLATKTDVGGAVEMGIQQVLSSPQSYNLFTQQQIQSERTAGQADVISSPNNFSLFSTNQIMDMRFGGMVLGRTNNQLVLNYQVLQSTNLQNWVPVKEETVILSNTPSSKMFLRLNPRQ